MHTITIIASHPRALREAREAISSFPKGVSLVTSPVLEEKGTAQVHVDAEGAILRDVVDMLDRGGWL